MASPSGEKRDALRVAAQERIDRWERELTVVLERLWEQQQGVVLARLRGTKARAGTRHWMPLPKTELKALDAGYIVDLARWIADAVKFVGGLLEGIYQETIGHILKGLGLPGRGRAGAVPVPDGAPAGSVFTPTPATPRPVPTRGVDRPARAAASSTAPTLDVDVPTVPDRDGSPVPIVESDVVQALLQARVQQAAQQVAAKTEQVADVIRTGEAEGVPIEQIADRVEQLYTARAPGWTRQIVQTNVVGAVNESSMAAAAAAGVGQKQWLAAHDNRVRDSHRTADGKVVPITSVFTLDRGTVAYPGDPAGDPAEVINCLPDGDTPILTRDGVMPIRDVQVGDLVVTHLGRLRPVLRLSRRRAVVPIVTFGLADGRRLRATVNHPVLTSEGWMVAGELVPGVLVATAASVQSLDGLVGVDLRGVDLRDTSSTPTTRKQRHGQDALGTLPFDDEVGQYLSEHGTAGSVGRLPAADWSPVLAGCGAVVDGSDASQFAAELDESSVAVCDEQSLLELVGVGLSGRVQSSDGHDAFSVDQGSKVGGSNGLHASMVLQTIVTCSLDAPTDVELWNFAVEEDESYIAGGIAVHNCRCTLLFPLPVLGQPIYDPAMFSSKILAGPTHAPAPAWEPFAGNTFSMATKASDVRALIGAHFGPAALNSENTLVIAAHDTQGRVAGYFAWQSYPEPGHPVGSVRGAWVHRAHRGQGLGAQLQRNATDIEPAVRAHVSFVKGPS